MEVVLFEDRYLEQIVEFLRQVWNKDVTIEDYSEGRRIARESNPYGVEGGFPTAIALEEGKVVGHLRGTPCRLWAHGKELPNHWVSGLHVLPESRGHGVATAVQWKIHELPVKTSFWVIEATRKLKKKLGWQILGKIPDYLKVLDARSFFKKIDLNRLKQGSRLLSVLTRKGSLSGWLARTVVLPQAVQAYNTLWRIRGSLRHSTTQMRLTSDFDQGVDQLWERNRDQLKFCQVRRSAYLNWYFNHAKGWIKFTATADSETVGYAILSFKQLDHEASLPHMKVLSIIDLFWDFERPETLNDMLAYIEAFGRQQGAEILLCSINFQAAHHVLIRNGFLRIPSTINFSHHSSETSPQLSPDLADWFLTRGDGDAAGALAPG